MDELERTVIDTAWNLHNLAVVVAQLKDEVTQLRKLVVYKDEKEAEKETGTKRLTSP